MIETPAAPRLNPGPGAATEAASTRRIAWSLAARRWLAWPLSATGALLIAATMVAALLRLVDLGAVPPGLNQDEAVSGYDAFSLIQTGRDHHGHPFPFAGLESFGDWVSPLLTFLTAPAVGLFGLKVEVLRAVTAIVGIAAVPLIYRLAVELFGRRSIGVIAAWLIAISPWHTHLSRWAIPTPLVPTMVIATLLALVWTVRRRSGGGLILFALLAGLTVSAYPTMKLFAPLLLLAAAIVYGPILLRLGWGSIATAGAVFVILAGPPLFLSTFDPGGSARLDQVSVFRDGNPGLETLLRHYGNYLAPRFLFTQGDHNPMHLPAGYGVELRSMLPFLVLGLIWLGAALVRRTWLERRSAGLVLLTLALYPIPGSLTVPSPHDLRAAHLIPLLALIGAVGVVVAAELVLRLVRRAKPATARGALLLIWVVPFLVLMPIEVVSRHRDYQNDYPRTVDVAFHQGLLPALTYARQSAAGYDEIWVADVNQPYIYVLFEAEWPPSEVHRLLQVVRDPPAFNVVESFGKYRFSSTIGGGVPPEIEAALPGLGLYFWSPNLDGGIAYEVRGGPVPGHGNVLVVHRP